MNPFDLISGLALVVLFPLFMLVLLRIIAPDGVDTDSLLRLPSDLEWPRGVQEEEPVRWHVERLSRRESDAIGATSPLPVPDSHHSGVVGSIRGATPAE